MAVGSSDGEYYPSRLEGVLTQMASTEASGMNPIDTGRVNRNKDYEQFRNENDLPGAPYQDIRRKTRVAQGDQSYDTNNGGSDMEWRKPVPPSYSGEITDSWQEIKQWRGRMIDTYTLSPQDLRQQMQEEGTPTPVQPAPLAPKEKNPRRPMTENDVLPNNARVTAADVGSSTLQAILDSFTNPDSKVPTQERMVQAGIGKAIQGPTEEEAKAGKQFSDEVWFANKLNQSRMEEFAKTPTGQILDALNLGLNAIGIRTPVARSQLPRVNTILEGKYGLGEAEAPKGAANMNVDLRGGEAQFNKAKNAVQSLVDITCLTN